MYQIFLHPKILVVFKTNINCGKNSFLICSIVPTTMIVKSSMMFSCLLLCVVMFCSDIDLKHGSSYVWHCFVVFAIQYNTIIQIALFFTQVITWHMRKYTKNIQGGSQLRDKARSMRFAQSKRQSIVYNCPPHVKVMSSISGWYTSA